MKKFIKIFFLVALVFAFSSDASALVKVRKKVLSSDKKMWITSFIDYPPFGQVSKYKDSIDTVFQPFIDIFNEKSTNKMEYYVSGTYDELVFDVVEGRVDVLLGAYYDTRLYDGIKLVYPAILNNPLVLITMPDSSLNIKSKNDLKKLKGAVDSREYFAGYVEKELKEYNITKFDNSEKLYEQLFIGNVDYIITSKYYGAIEQAKLGIRDLVVMSKNTLWDMPLFIGVSALQRKGFFIANTLKEFLKTNQKHITSEIEKRIIDEVRKADEASVGVVPPAYVK